MLEYAKPKQKQSQSNKDTVQKQEEQPIVRPNTTGIPDAMKARFEGLSGFSFDDVKIHYNSDKPEKVQALAYTQGNDVHIAPGQEKHLGHELGHVVQQKQGRVRPTVNIGGLAVNDDKSLEREANMINYTTAQLIHSEYSDIDIETTNNVIQLMPDLRFSICDNPIEPKGDLCAKCIRALLQIDEILKGIDMEDIEAKLRSFTKSKSEEAAVLSDFIIHKNAIGTLIKFFSDKLIINFVEEPTKTSEKIYGYVQIDPELKKINPCLNFTINLQTSTMNSSSVDIIAKTLIHEASHLTLGTVDMNNIKAFLPYIKEDHIIDAEFLTTNIIDTFALASDIGYKTKKLSKKTG